MTRRERLRRCYFHEELDRPAVYVRTNYPRNDPSYDRLREYLEANTELKRAWGPAWTAAHDSESFVEPVNREWQRGVSILKTSAGDLRSSRMESLRGQPGLQEEHLLKNRGDAEKYLSLPDPPADADLSGFFEADKGIGDVGILDVRAGRSPGGHVAQLFGSEQFAIMTLTDRDILHELCRQAQRWLLAKVKHLLAGGVGPYFSLAAEEYVAPPLHGPDDFRDFIVRYEKPVIDLIHEAGGRVHVHCHGRIGRIFDGFIEMGTDVLHPFEPPPLGDITAAEAKSLARGKMCLEGNLQIATMYESTPEAIRAETTRLIEDAFDDRRGLIVCPSASPYIRGEGEQCYENFRAMVETVLNWRS